MNDKPKKPSFDELWAAKKPKRPDTTLFSKGSHGGIDDRYYIDEIIGIEELTYDDWIGSKK
jgi:hypothetical protein|tara:strand:- start:189 stop:371 length:183 start_codon:yes stop_codon:yes gene_type:complete